MRCEPGTVRSVALHLDGELLLDVTVELLAGGLERLRWRLERIDGVRCLRDLLLAFEASSLNELHDRPVVVRFGNGIDAVGLDVVGGGEIVFSDHVPRVVGVD